MEFFLLSKLWLMSLQVWLHEVFSLETILTWILSLKMQKALFTMYSLIVFNVILGISQFLEATYEWLVVGSSVWIANTTRSCTTSPPHVPTTSPPCVSTTPSLSVSKTLSPHVSKTLLPHLHWIFASLGCYEQHVPLSRVSLQKL